jgi:predicted transcriptional regulator
MKKNKTPKIRFINIRVDDERYAKLLKLAETYGITRTKIMTMALDQVNQIDLDTEEAVRIRTSGR